jgi:hypothetical protein
MEKSVKDTKQATSTSYILAFNRTGEQFGERRFFLFKNVFVFLRTGIGNT